MTQQLIEQAKEVLRKNDRGNYTVTVRASDNGNGVPAAALSGTASAFRAARLAPGDSAPRSSSSSSPLPSRAPSFFPLSLSTCHTSAIALLRSLTLYARAVIRHAPPTGRLAS